MQHINIIKNIENLKSNILTLEFEKGKIETNIGKKNKNIGQFRKQIGALNIEIGKIQKLIGEHEKHIGLIEKDIGEHEKHIGLIEKDIGTLQHKVNNTNRVYKNGPYYKVMRWIENNVSDTINSFNDSLSDGQFKSKKWLIDQLKKTIYSYEPLHLEVVGGWFGYPLIEMLNVFRIKQIDFYEIDPICKKVLQQYINYFEPNYKIAIFDNYFNRKERRTRDLIINTSSEHMQDISVMKEYYKNKPLVAIQSNDFNDIEDHINCVNSCQELIEKNEFNIIRYEGVLNLKDYNRYMVIGKW